MWQPPTLEEMQAMLSQYRFESLLGRGGMGAVYKAVQVSLERPVAIKVLPGDLIDDTDAQFAERFKNEARTMAKMNHPAIVNVYDFGETQTGLLFIVMEFIDGTDVAKMISSQGKLPEDYALSITAHVCDALNYAHRNGVIHRDIKPANILINMDGSVKVADFGLAKQSDAGASGLTKTNMAMGTPDFVAPEALIPGVLLDGRADLYAIGVMLYQMLTGEIPRGMWTMPGLKLGTDPRFDEIIGKAMQTDREERYQSAAAIRQDLDTILTTPRVLKPQPVDVPERPAQTTQKPVTHGPRPPQGQKLAESPQNVSPSPKKSSVGLMCGLGATAALLVGGYFVMKPVPQVKPAVVSTVPVESKPVSPLKPAPKPDPIPKPAVSPALPAPPKRSAKQTLDLLALTDPLKDRMPVPGMIAKNEWKREGSELIFLPDGKAGKLAVPVAFQCRDYEIEFKAKRHSGNDRIHLDVPLQNGRILPLILNAQGRKVLNEKEGLDWGVAGSGEFHVTIRVIDGAGASDRIIIERKNPNPKQLADWSGDLDKLAKAGEDLPGFPKQPVSSVFVMRDKYAVQVWTLRVFEGAAKVLRAILVPQSKPAVVTPPVAAVVPTMPETAASTPPKTSGPVMSGTPVLAPVPATDGVSLKLADFEAKFQTAFDRDAGAAYKAQLAILNTGYTAALERALAVAAKAGKLDDVLVLREEKERMTSGKALPPEDLDTLPDAVKKLRGTWRSAEVGYAKQRDMRAVPLFDAYDKVLDAYQTELTKQNKIDDALRVKTARDELVTRFGTSAAPAEEKVAAAKSGTTPPAAAVAVEASSSWRKAAEWILTVGGQIHIRRNEGGDASVKDAKELPGGRFDIIGITLDLPNGKGSQITDDDLTRLNGLRSIESVRMSHLTSLTGSGFAALAASADSMRHFAVYNSPLQAQHMGLITQFKNLRLLELNRIQSLPAESLAKIQVFAELTQLRLLGQMNLSDKTLLGLAGLTKLTEFSMPGAPITDEGLVGLKGMKVLTSVDMNSCKGITGSGLVHLAGAKELAILHLSHSAANDVALSHLSGLSKLRDIELNQTDITDDGIKHLVQLKELQALEIGAKGITGASLNLLSGCRNLTRLDLFDRSNATMTAVDDAGLQSLASAELPKLKELSFARGRVTDVGMAYLSAMKLTKLRTNEPPGLEGLRQLAKITTLESLELGRGDLTDEGLAVLAGMKSLKTLISAASQVTDAGLEVLQDMTGLKALTLKDSKVSQAGFEALSKARSDLKVSK